MFVNKATTTSWITKTEHELETGNYIQDTKNTQSDGIDCYLDIISPLKKSYDKEVLRLNSFRKDFANKNIVDVKPSDIALGRNKRLKDVSHGTVKREADALRSIIQYKKKEMWLNWSIPICHN